MFGTRIVEPPAIMPAARFPIVSRLGGKPAETPVSGQGGACAVSSLAPYRRASTAMVRGSSLPLIRDRGVRAFFLMEVQRD